LGGSNPGTLTEQTPELIWLEGEYSLGA
jgi:hypothetical protein